jgi:uncharacterized protein
MTGDARYLPDGWPLPEVNEFSRAFLTTGSLALQTCRACAAVQHPPGELCLTCGSFDFDYVEAPARGTISSYTVVHHAMHPLLVDTVPYNVILVELDAFPGVRIVGNLLDAADGDLTIGRQVTGTWTAPLSHEGQESVRLLQWRLVRH